jgi:hypothetical protein
VSRQYNEICTPLLYQELNLDIIYLHTYSELQKILQDVVNPHGRNVRSIRIHLGKSVRGEWYTCTRILALLLSKCSNATTLAVYYKDGTEPPFGELSNQIVRMIESNQIVRFGLFSASIMKTLKGSSMMWSLRDIDAPMQMLEQILRSPRACQALQRLDLVMEDLSHDLFMLICSNLTSLRSLTIRRALRSRLPGIFDKIGQQLWSQNDHLTSLNLMGCNSAHAAQMSLLVKHFRNLQELVWATCGHYNDPIPSYPQAGWSKDPTSLHHLRRPLKLLVLEHALEWEICVMSMIPAETLIVTHPDELRLTRSLERRVEMFPGMKTLRVLPKQSPNESQSNAVSDTILARGAILESLCNDLGVVLSRDAELLHPCTCCR